MIAITPTTNKAAPNVHQGRSRRLKAACSFFGRFGDSGRDPLRNTENTSVPRTRSATLRPSDDTPRSAQTIRAVRTNKLVMLRATFHGFSQDL